MANRYLSDLAGTMLSSFRIGAAGAQTLLKYISGGFAVRNAGDSADAALTASNILISGDSFTINSDSAGSAADWKIIVQRPAAGMSADWTLTLPPDNGSPNQFLQTDGSGVTTWQTVSAGSSNLVLTDDTALAFGDSSPVTMFTKPAGSKPKLVRIYVDTAFDGTAPTVSIGIIGTTSKYGATTQVDLKTVGIYEWDPGIDVTVGAENLIATYAADSSAVGAARIEIDYVTPS